MPYARTQAYGVGMEELACVHPCLCAGLNTYQLDANEIGNAICCMSFEGDDTEYIVVGMLTAASCCSSTVSTKRRLDC